MKLLICIGHEEWSEPTIRFGGKVAKAFDADVSVLYVGPEMPHSVRKAVELAHTKLSEWKIDTPGVRVLRMARDILLQMGLVKTTKEGKVVQRHALKAGIHGAYEIHICGLQGAEIRLRLREGDIVEQISAEAQVGGYDLVILGASRKRRLLHEIAQFVPASLMVVKDARDVFYRYLICTDGSEAAHRAELFGAKVAKSLHSKVTLLSIAEKEDQLQAAQQWANRASRFLERGGIPYEVRVRLGPLVGTIVQEAATDHIIVLGVSSRSEITKFLLGSRPIKVIQEAPCPVILVK